MIFENFQNFGPALCLGLAAIGSSIGCGLAGMTSHGAMAKVDEGHAKFVALSAMPASQSIYGFALMIILQGALKAENDFAIFGIGLACGLAFMVSAIFQGKACSSKWMLEEHLHQHVLFLQDTVYYLLLPKLERFGS